MIISNLLRTKTSSRKSLRTEYHILQQEHFA